MFARHRVKDFGKWKSAYDAFDAERRTMGVTGHGVFRNEDDANNVTVYHEFKNVEAAKAFADSERLREIMEGAGVIGTPDIWITTKA